MKIFFTIISIIIIILVFLSLIRGIYGPGILNRIVGINVIGTKVVVILLLIGFIYERIEIFVDISLAYAILNFIVTLFFAKYLERKGNITE